MKGYTYYKLNDSTVKKLKKLFPPQYSKFIGHHVTWKFGDVSEDDIPPNNAKIELVGYADSEDGLEALVVSVNGKTERPDGSVYHVTWSLDPAKYSPVDSNELLQKQGWKSLFYKMFIDASPEINIFNKKSKKS
ncbi:hypothetical protein PBI_SCTP2_296 [Salicola phage SCTP-2]|nr:hypothetical protein PBI_SCTP2_296 [Salicola phage SCTP-2]